MPVRLISSLTWNPFSPYNFFEVELEENAGVIAIFMSEHLSSALYLFIFLFFFCLPWDSFSFLSPYNVTPWTWTMDEVRRHFLLSTSPQMTFFSALTSQSQRIHIIIILRASSGVDLDKEFTFPLKSRMNVQMRLFTTHSNAKILTIRYVYVMYST